MTAASRGRFLVHLPVHRGIALSTWVR